MQRTFPVRNGYREQAHERADMGCKTIFNQELAALIVEKLSAGTPMAQICREAGMPNRETVRLWTKDNKEFADAIAEARADGHDVIAADCLQIADERNYDDNDDVQHRKLRIWTRQQLLAKWDPKRYGDKLDLNHSGSVSIANTLRAAREARKAGD